VNRLVGRTRRGVSNSSMLAALQQAVINDELVLYYQPKVCLLTGNIIGAEALVRWPDGESGVLSPSEFLPLAESSGLLHDLTLKLLDQVIDASVSLTSDHASVSLSINVAPDDLASNTISNRILQALGGQLISPADLQIEITESAVMGNVDRVNDDLVRLKNMGIKILMDDFGTGYSSIDRLSQLPFDALKLDQGMVKRMGKSRQNLNVVRSSISMARELGMTSVAEGIESAAVFNFLIAHGCEEGQGYYIGKPMSLDDFKAFVDEDHHFEGSQIGRIHQASLSLLRFRKELIDAAFCQRIGDGNAMESVAEPRLHPLVEKSSLGLWYFGSGQHLRANEAFRNIEQPLREFHHNAIELMGLLQRLSSTELDNALTHIDAQVDQLSSLYHRLERVLLDQALLE